MAEILNETKSDMVKLEIDETSSSKDEWQKSSSTEIEEEDDRKKPVFINVALTIPKEIVTGNKSSPTALNAKRT